MSHNTSDASLHVPSLRIKGFRGIDSLTINRFGRVTLLTGRNGTGKTTVLEAIRIFADRGRLSSLVEVLNRSEELSGRASEENEIAEIPDFKALFHGRQANVGTSFTIGLNGDTQAQLLAEVSSIENVPDEWMSRSRSIMSDQVLRIAFSDFEEFLPVFDGDMFERWRSPRFPTRDNERPETVKAEVLGPGLLNNLDLDQRWGEIALTEQEPIALRALNLAASQQIDAVAVVAGDSRSRSRFRRILVRLEDGARVPLRSLGDGAVRLFGVATALAGASGGLLLLDEAENGIHHSLQHEYWSLVLRAAADNNVQVIATTHGWDCIRGFASASRENEDADGTVVRLERDADGLSAVEYSEEELQTAPDQGIEVR